jgi:hypothetical protein
VTRYVQAARASAPVIVAALGLVVLALAALVFVSSSGFGYDFRAYDAAARRIAGGDALYLPGTIEAYRDGRFEGLYLYPPVLAIALIPLTVLGQADATLAWLVLRVGLLVAGCLALPVSWRTRAAVLGVAGLSFPVLFDLNIGNVSIVVFALCAAAWRWLDSPIGAVAHAALIALRFPFGIFAVTWLVQRRLRTLAWTIAAGLVLIVIGLPVVGISSYAEYFAILRGLPDISTGPHNLSFKSLALAAGLPDAIVALALPFGYLLGLASIVFAARRRDASTAFVVTATATLLVAPFIHPHYLVLLLLPSAWLMDRGHWWGFALPLLGWLPDVVLPLAGPLAIGLVLAVREARPVVAPVPAPAPGRVAAA